jgi:hypothetical protein
MSISGLFMRDGEELSFVNGFPHKVLDSTTSPDSDKRRSPADQSLPQFFFKTTPSPSTLIRINSISPSPIHESLQVAKMVGKKKRNHPDVEELLARPWCYYCKFTRCALHPRSFANMSRKVSVISMT